MSVPCEMWTTAEAVEACGEVTCSDEQLDQAIASASYVLYLLSRRKYPGICEDQVRPYAAPSAAACCLQGVERSWGFMTAGDDWACFPHGLTCCSTCESRVALGKWPVTDITAVEIDGVLLDASEYSVIGRRWLQRMADADGKRQAWPHTQRLDLPLGEDGTWAVTFLYGAEIPQPGRDAAAVLAREWCLACEPGEGECALPPNVQTYVRQGVTVSMLDIDSLFRGRTGIDIADRWLAAERYADSTAGGAAFYNPDDVAHVESIWQPLSS